MAKKAPVVLFIGADHTLEITVVDSAEQPQTMTGWALEWVLRAQSFDGSGTVQTTKTTAGGQIATASSGGTNNRADITVARADTLSLPPGVYEHTLWRTDGGANTVIAWGPCTLAHPARQ